MRIHRDGAAPLGVMRFDHLFHFAFGDELNAGVNGEANILAGLRLALDDRFEIAPLDVARDVQLAGMSLKTRFQTLLDSAVAFLSEIDAADNVRGERLIRIEALALAAELNPIEFEIAQALRLFGGDLALDPDESVLGGGGFAHPREQVVRVHVQDFCQDVGGDWQIGDAQRIDADGFSGQADGEALAHPIHDGSARSLQLERFFLLMDGELLVLGVLDDLELDQAGGNQRYPDEGQAG